MKSTHQLAMAFGAVLLVSACASQPEPTSIPTTPTSAPAVLANALERTRTAGGAEITVDMLTTVDGVDDALSGQGNVALDRDLGEMSWESAAGASVERTTSEGVFVQLDPPAGRWLLAPEGTPTSGAMSPLRGLGELADVRTSGVEELSIGAAERFTGSLPAATYVKDMGLNPTASDAVAADPRASIDVTVWIDREGQVRRIMRTLRTAVPVSAATFTDLIRFGSPIDVKTPTDYDTAT